jgi:hypothetical protein
VKIVGYPESKTQEITIQELALGNCFSNFAQISINRVNETHR